MTVVRLGSFFLLGGLVIGCSSTKVQNAGPGSTVKGSPGVAINNPTYVVDKRTKVPNTAFPDSKAPPSGGPLATEIEGRRTVELTDNGRATDAKGAVYVGGSKVANYKGETQETWKEAKLESTGNGVRFTGPSYQLRGSYQATIPPPKVLTDSVNNLNEAAKNFSDKLNQGVRETFQPSP